MNDGDQLTLECDVKDADKWEIIDANGGVFMCSGTQILELNGESESFILRNRASSQIPTEFTLFPAFPNPFNPSTSISYDLPEKVHVSIMIHDMLGRQVRTLINQTQDAGFKSVIWNATNDYGEPVSAGVYLYQIQAGEFVQTRKMVLLK